VPGMVAARVPVNIAAGAGGFQRNGPTGGAAYGMPLNERSVAVELPWTGPAVVVTTFGSVFMGRAPETSALHEVRGARLSEATNRSPSVERCGWFTVFVQLSTHRISGAH
jgi:hypothetical protein